MIDHLRPGQDEVVVWKLDRLGRNTRNLLELIDDLESRGIHFRSLTEGIATTGPMGTAMLTVMSAFAQLSATSWPNGPRQAWLRRLNTDARLGGEKSPPNTRRSHAPVN